MRTPPPTFSMALQINYIRFYGYNYRQANPLRGLWFFSFDGDQVVDYTCLPDRVLLYLLLHVTKMGSIEPRVLRIRRRTRWWWRRSS